MSPGTLPVRCQTQLFEACSRGCAHRRKKNMFSTSRLHRFCCSVSDHFATQIFFYFIFM